MSASNTDDPFTILGVLADADESEVRARYLELVKQFPPERDPEKFHQIRAAFDAVKDPLSIAKRLLAPPDQEDVPEWSKVIEAQKQHPPRLSTALLLSLGNRSGPEKAVEPPRS